MYLMDEKRRNPRVDFRIPIQYRNLRSEVENVLTALNKNLGKGGVCFISNEFLSLASRLVLEISLPNLARPIKVISKVAWVRKMPLSDQYQIGSQFLEMTNEDREQVQKYVDKNIPVTA